MDDGLGYIALGMLAFGIMVQQYNYRFGLSGLRTLQHDFLLRNLDVEDYNSVPAASRVIWKKAGGGNRLRKRKRKQNTTFNGLYSAASTAFNTIKGEQSCNDLAIEAFLPITTIQKS